MNNFDILITSEMSRPNAKGKGFCGGGEEIFVRIKSSKTGKIVFSKLIESCLETLQLKNGNYGGETKLTISETLKFDLNGIVIEWSDETGRIDLESGVPVYRLLKEKDLKEETQMTINKKRSPLRPFPTQKIDNISAQIYFDRNSSKYTMYLEGRTDNKSTPVWRTKLYERKYNPDLEMDVQEIWIREFKAENKNFQIVDEKKNVFVIRAEDGKLLSPDKQIEYEPFH